MKPNAENLLEEGTPVAAPTKAKRPQTVVAEAAAKPAGLPEQFWDAETASVKLDELIAAYNDLVARDENLIEGNLRGIPASPADYQINIPSPLLERDDEIFQRFYDKKFTNDQAQLVYDLANERVLPFIEEMTVNFEAERQIEKLVKHFGGRERFNEISRQLSSWARQNLSPEVYDALASTSEGVIALYKMMSSNEPVLSRETAPAEELSEETLRKMMEDPRYWRDHDKAYVRKITSGFEKLYPGK